jgi:hypothetical protein
VKFFLALSRGTCDPFQLAIFPFGIYQTTRQTLHHLPRLFVLQRQDIDLLEEICNCPNVSYVARKRKLGAEFATPYLLRSTNVLRNTTLLQENTKQKEKTK